MKVGCLLAACALSWIMWGIAALCIAHKAQLHAIPADYQDCRPVHTAPLIIRRQKIGVPPVTDLT